MISLMVEGKYHNTRISHYKIKLKVEWTFHSTHSIKLLMLAKINMFQIRMITHGSNRRSSKNRQKRASHIINVTKSTWTNSKKSKTNCKAWIEAIPALKAKVNRGRELSSSNLLWSKCSKKPINRLVKRMIKIVCYQEIRTSLPQTQ